ncbi:hypothetical protein [Kitasatospora kifunensis]|uniref:Uncharacterized protein n=1 Tax=Kitasatospora kifunensis TaxID=58351 RepID=A0A7W7VZS0_KITKI|nr:hypothetical protein [Kitasatospora kifunensis]MBB4928393.1 hypothetical protein [Kitasatospora kifunensis]
MVLTAQSLAFYPDYANDRSWGLKNNKAHSIQWYTGASTPLGDGTSGGPWLRGGTMDVLGLVGGFPEGGPNPCRVPGVGAGGRGCW